MENKINIAELLKDCPKGMELDCTIFENLEFDHIDKNNGKYPIICRVKTEWGGYNIHSFTEYGCYSIEKYSKCAIFPKGKTTWERFQRPFKNGDIVFYNDIIAIFKEWGDETLFRTYVIRYLYEDSVIIRDVPLFGKSVRKEIRLATEEEKQKLFQTIKENGYKWNAETKTLEKLPKFKVGNRVKKKDFNEDAVLITDITDNYYVVETKYGMEVTISIDNQNNYELVPNKFDITTLKPFESRVLVKSSYGDIWRPAIYGFTDSGKHYIVGGVYWEQCIPYEGNEHLLGTTDNCDEYYKNWK